MNKYDDTDYLIEREESIEYEEKVKRQTENTINYYKNIEKIEEIPIDILRAMYKDMLAELEQDKKRIRELEEENKKYIAQLTDEQYRNLVDIIKKEVKKEFEQKVKDKIDEINKKYEDSKDESGESPYYYPEYTIRVLEKLLEEK